MFLHFIFQASSFWSLFKGLSLGCLGRSLDFSKVNAKKKKEKKVQIEAAERLRYRNDVHVEMFSY